MNNTWSRRIAKKYTCPSGNEVMVQRSSPSLVLKSQRFLPILKRISGPDGQAKAEDQLVKLLELPDDELEKMTDYAEIVIADAVVQPPLSLNPKVGELSPRDIPQNDFWMLFFYISSGCPEIPVQTKDGETSVEAVANFPEGQDASPGVSAHSESVQ